MCLASNDADGFEAELPAGRRSGMDMVRPGTAEGEQRILSLCAGLYQVVLELAPFVAAEMRIGEIVAFDQ